MEQILACLLAKMNAIQEKMETNQDRMEAKIGSEIKTTQEKMDDRK
jgi:hypothetical protein